MKRSKLLPLLVEAATVGLQTKARVVRRSSRRNTARRIYANQEREIEAALEKAIAPLVEEQVASVRDGLLEIEGVKAVTTSDQAQALASQVFDPNDQKWKDGLVDRALPVMVVPMLKAMKAAMVEAGVNPTKGMKFNPSHDPRSGRFISGSGGGTGGGKPGTTQKPETGGNRKVARKRTDDDTDRDYDDLASKRNPISLSATRGMRSYTGDDYKEVNEDLRGGKDIKDMHHDIVSLNDYCKQSIPTTIVYRGVSGKRINEMMEGAGKNGVIEAKGLVSTTTSMQLANDWGAGAVMEIKAKTGGVAGKFSTHNENEIVQAHGTKYKFLGREKSTGFYGEDIDIYMFEET